MIKHQKNKYSMYVGVRAYLDKHVSGYEDNIEFNEHINSYKAAINEIELKEDERNKATKGKVKSKTVSRETASDLALAAAGALYSFAKKRGDVTLMDSVKHRRSGFTRMRDALLVIELNSILDKSKQYRSEISRFGITPEILSEFENEVMRYTEALGAKNTGSATKSGAKKTMAALFSEADSLLDSIGRFMDLYRIKDPEFFAGYRSARSIKDLGIRHTGGNSKKEITEDPVVKEKKNSKKNEKTGNIIDVDFSIKDSALKS